MNIEDAIEKYGPLVMKLAWRVSKDEDDAKDIYQETFLKFHAELNKELHIGHPKAWLCRTALNMAIKRVQRQNKLEPIEEATGVTWESGSLQYAERKILIEEIRQFIDHLPKRQHEVFVLRYFEDLSFEEIANTLNCQPGAARAAAFQALKKIRAWLTDSSAVSHCKEGNEL